MKKVVIVLLLVTLVVGGAFAQMKAGVGVKGGTQTITLTAGGKSGEDKYGTFGANAFLDIGFLELNADFMMGAYLFGLMTNVNTTDLVLGVVGKFPIPIMDKITVFPFVGADYNINLSTKNGDNELKDSDLEGTGYSRADFMSRLSIIFGAGLDFNLSDSMFIRGEVGYGITLPNKVDNDMIDALKALSSSDVTLQQSKFFYKACIGFKL